MIDGEMPGRAPPRIPQATPPTAASARPTVKASAKAGITTTRATIPAAAGCASAQRTATRKEGTRRRPRLRPGGSPSTPPAVRGGQDQSGNREGVAEPGRDHDVTLPQSPACLRRAPQRRTRSSTKADLAASCDCASARRAILTLPDHNQGHTPRAGWRRPSAVPGGPMASAS